MRSRQSFWFALVALVACKQSTGLYVDIHTSYGTQDPGFDSLELFFSSPNFPAKACDNSVTADLHVIDPLQHTAGWTRPSFDGSGNYLLDADGSNDIMMRRQPVTGDHVTFSARKDFTIQLTDLGDYPADFGGEGLVQLQVVASLQGTVVSYATQIDLDLESADPDRIDVSLNGHPMPDPQTDPNFEIWGAGGSDLPSCMRFSLTDNMNNVIGQQFVVREWDHDCDGMLANYCDFTGSAQLREDNPEDDCAPNSYCGSDGTSETCGAPFSYIGSGAVNRAGETVYPIAACINTLPQTPIAPGPGPRAMLGPSSACMIDAVAGSAAAQHCDRTQGECMLQYGDPDITCTVPVSDGDSNDMAQGLVANQVCVDGIPLVPVDAGLNCSLTVVAQLPSTIRRLPLAAHFFAASAPDANGYCPIVMGAPYNNSPARLASSARIVVAVTGTALGTPGQGSVLVAVKRQPTSCTAGSAAVTCGSGSDSGSGSGVPLAVMPHFCPS